MSSPTPRVADRAGLREMALRPRDSDGVGSALRHIFSSNCGIPADFRSLLSHLDKAN